MVSYKCEVCQRSICTKVTHGIQVAKGFNGNDRTIEAKSHKTEIFTTADWESWLSVKEVDLVDRHGKSIKRK